MNARCCSNSSTGLLSANTYPDVSLIGADAALRDFTVDALYYAPIDNALLAPSNGMDDLAAHTLRSIVGYWLWTSL
ncbi:hypothetical protein [Janthinobacterium sp. LB3P118]|uniref:hypothetical protein n=1 Tax=Janthinobacterium sp. LB3P118 TaxID=3424195 RepID=UPI003F25F228